ncbi:MAG: GreA/GreB family elongation factor [Verrucomicrobia bacterium]|nr:GreA/GreB family elongation factor [Verrucomicrobiota bacterium]
MSKAFTREDDDAPEFTPAPRPVATLPPGAKNYLTPGGAEKLRAEINRLAEIERPRLAAATDDATAKQQLSALDARVRQLRGILDSAVVAPPPPPPHDQVRFGATVTVREPGGEETSYRLVGVDETDLDRNWVSWLSPIAKALMNARLGQRVRFKFPSGEAELEIVGIGYE